MAEPEKQPKQPKDVQQKEVIACKVTGTVKWFNVKSGYGFINRNDTKEDIFVHQSAIVKNNPKKLVRSVGDGEVVEFDIVVGSKGNEAANVTGPNGDAVKGSPYAADKRKRYRPWYYSNRPPPRPRRQREGEGDEKKGEAPAQPQHRRFRPMYRPNYGYRPRPRGPPRDPQQDGGGEGGKNRSGPRRRGPIRRFFPRRYTRQPRRPRSDDPQENGQGEDPKSQSSYQKNDSSSESSNSESSENTERK